MPQQINSNLPKPLKYYTKRAWKKGLITILIATIIAVLLSALIFFFGKSSWLDLRIDVILLFIFTPWFVFTTIILLITVIASHSYKRNKK